jgi:hypothetical protein
MGDWFNNRRLLERIGASRPSSSKPPRRRNSNQKTSANPGWSIRAVCMTSKRIAQECDDLSMSPVWVTLSVLGMGTVGRPAAAVSGAGNGNASRRKRKQ